MHYIGMAVQGNSFPLAKQYLWCGSSILKDETLHTCIIFFSRKKEDMAQPSSMPLESSKQGGQCLIRGALFFPCKIIWNGKTQVQISLMILEVSSSPHTPPPHTFTRALISIDSCFHPERETNHVQREQEITSWA